MGIEKGSSGTGSRSGRKGARNAPEEKRRRIGRRESEKHDEEVGEYEALEVISRETQPGTQEAASAQEELGQWLPGLPTDAIDDWEGADGRQFGSDLPDAGDIGLYRGFGAAASGGFGIRRVFQSDDRVRIFNTDQDPYRRICFLEITTGNGKGLSGTGWLVGPRTVITAGHCVWTRPWWNGFAKRIVVYPGRDGRRFELKTQERDLQTVSQWANSGDPRYDFGAIFLDESIGEEAGYFGFADFADADLSRMRVSVAGYPGDKPPATMWAHSQKIAEVLPQQLRYYVDTYPGQSGAPVIYWDGDEYSVVGIHNQGPSAGNLATRITPAVYDQIKKWKQ